MKSPYILVFVGIFANLVACTGTYDMRAEQLPLKTPNYSYLLGPGDIIDVFVWRNEELSATNVPVRPDGKISSPLVEEVVANGKTPQQLARDLEQQLAKYIKDPFVTITVRDFKGRLNDQIKVVGEAANPQVLQYKENLSVLDVMIAVGGLTEFAAGNRASIIRTVDGKQTQARVRLEDLLKYGDISANVKMQPGDVIIIPETWF
jgi:polysaccharide export outer membrane protein